MRQQSVDSHLVCMSVCVYTGTLSFFLGLHVYECSCVFNCAQAEASSPLPWLCPCGSESPFEELVPNGWGNIGDVPPRAIWWPAELTPSAQSWSTASGNCHTTEPPPLHSNQQSFTSTSCYLYQVGMGPGTWLRETKTDAKIVAEEGRIKIRQREDGGGWEREVNIIEMHTHIFLTGIQSSCCTIPSSLWFISCKDSIWRAMSCQWRKLKIVSRQHLFSKRMMSTKVPNGLRDKCFMSFSPALI